MNTDEIQQAFQSLIRGRGVRRGSHELLLEGRDTTPLFLETLFLEGFKPACVDEMEISPGERIPAFFIDGGIAHFGWIFWEVFSPGRMRRIFGSVARNEKGDWAIVLGKGNKQILYTNIELKELMDVEHPSAF